MESGGRADGRNTGEMARLTMRGVTGWLSKLGAALRAGASSSAPGQSPGMLLQHTAPAAHWARIAQRERRRRRCLQCCVSSAGGLPFSPAQTRESLLAKEALFVDVRSEREFKDEHLPGTINLPLFLVPTSVPRGGIDMLMDRRLSDRSSDEERESVLMNRQFEDQLQARLRTQDSQRVLFLCSNGKRAAYVANALAGDGYQAAFLVGGLSAWLAVYDRSGTPRKRAQAGVFKDTSGKTIWTDSAEEDTILPARGGNENDLPDEEPRPWGAQVVVVE